MKFRILICLICLMTLFSSNVQAEESDVLPQLYISEILASNSLYPVEGRVCDWVELHNRGDEALSLEGLFLSDKASLPFWGKLSGSIKPGEYRVFPLDKEGLGFSLNKEGESLYLFNAGKEILDQAVFSAAEKDASLIRADKTIFETTWDVTPGRENRRGSRDTVDQRRFENAKKAGIIINEVLASDIANQFGKPNSDWVELYNPGNQSVSLKGLYLSDNAQELKKYALPGSALKPGKSLQIYCYTGDSKEKLRSKYINDAFEIKRTGGTLILSDGENIIDAVSLHTQFGGVSYGRPEGQGVFRYFETPTPQLPNPEQGCKKRLDKVSFTVTGGFVKEAFTLALTAAEGAVIRYTLNGDEPGRKSAVYKEPLFIEKNTVVRAKAYQEGFISSLTGTQTYLFEEAQSGIPVVCLAGEAALFFGDKGLFEEGNEGLVTERTLNTEIYDKNSHQAVNQLSGIRLTGGTSTVYVPRTFTLYARGSLEKDVFQFNPFQDRAYSAYSALTLRHGGTDTKRTRVRDAFLTRLANGFGVMYLASAPAQVYVNGEYWGAFNFREKANQDAIAQWEGLNNKDLIDRIDIVKNRWMEQKGSKADLEDLAAFCRANNLNDEEALKHVTDRLDVRSLFVHTAMEIISGNTDLSNVRYYRLPGGKWKLLLFDLDLSMYHNEREPLDFYLKSGRLATKNCFGELFNALMEVPKMRDQFLTLTGKLMAERFSPGFINQEMDQWRALYDPVFARHFDKWRSGNLTRWHQEMDKFQKYLLLRPKSVMNWLIKAYDLNAEDAEKYFGAFRQSLEIEK